MTENKTTNHAHETINHNPACNAGEPNQRAEERDFNDLNREEILALVKKVAAELGHRPNQFEFWQMAKAKKEHMRRLFGSYRELVQEAGFEALGPGFYILGNFGISGNCGVRNEMGRRKFSGPIG